MPLQNLRAFIDLLDQRNQLIRIKTPVPSWKSQK
jgi:3-polyprenyl-4-hydroxybenzoate decarboxylase